MNVAEMTLKKTCEMCPEQYDVLDRQGNTIAYMRLRHGYFEVTCPDVNGSVVYAACTNGDGSFFDDERPLHIGAAMLAIERHYAPGVWHNIAKEGLPEPYQTYIVALKEKYAWENEWRRHVDVADLVDDGGYIENRWNTFNDWDEGQEIHITHWMRKPELPEED